MNAGQREKWDAVMAGAGPEPSAVDSSFGGRTEVSFAEFCEARDREAWNGLSSAFRSGVRAAITGGECNYLFRKDFAAAWLRGNADAESFIRAGNVITPRPTWKRKERQ